MKKKRVNNHQTISNFLLCPSSDELYSTSMSYAILCPFNNDWVHLPIILNTYKWNVIEPFYYSTAFAWKIGSFNCMLLIILLSLLFRPTLDYHIEIGFIAGISQQRKGILLPLPSIPYNSKRVRGIDRDKWIFQYCENRNFGSPFGAWVTWLPNL